MTVDTEWLSEGITLTEMSQRLHPRHPLNDMDANNDSEALFNTFLNKLSERSQDMRLAYLTSLVYLEIFWIEKSVRFSQEFRTKEQARDFFELVSRKKDTIIEFWDTLEGDYSHILQRSWEQSIWKYMYRVIWWLSEAMILYFWEADPVASENVDAVRNDVWSKVVYLHSRRKRAPDNVTTPAFEGEWIVSSIVNQNPAWFVRKKVTPEEAKTMALYQGIESIFVSLQRGWYMSTELYNFLLMCLDREYNDREVYVSDKINRDNFVRYANEADTIMHQWLYKNIPIDIISNPVFQEELSSWWSKDVTSAIHQFLDRTMYRLFLWYGKSKWWDNLEGVLNGQIDDGIRRNPDPIGFKGREET